MIPAALLGPNSRRRTSDQLDDSSWRPESLRHTSGSSRAAPGDLRERALAAPAAAGIITPEQRIPPSRVVVVGEGEGVTFFGSEEQEIVGGK